ncbi:hypothetical protein QAD02_009691 [Eretmocerus hayati]|uniref:Uncharacterized protein n=1 Tax=Eretmocerus hayati TaxID=131215 RepID=A0ACC2NBA3_9HYME|nr:hypothetical protein QAD02_009691 [Eretmocerus hayati]
MPHTIIVGAGEFGAQSSKTGEAGSNTDAKAPTRAPTNISCAYQRYQNDKDGNTDEVFFSDAGHGNCFDNLRKSGQLSDFTVIVEDKKLYVHKVILAAVIPYYAKIFCTNGSDKSNVHCQTACSDIESLEACIEFAYSGRIRINRNNVTRLLMTAKDLSLAVVKDACINFIEQHSNSRNVLGYLQFAFTNKENSMIEYLENKIAHLFTTIPKNKEFFDLAYGLLRSIISRDDLNVSSEQEVYETVMKWVNHDFSSRETYLAELLRKVRLNVISVEYLLDKVASDDRIRKSEECRDIIDEAKSYHLSTFRKNRFDYVLARSCDNVSGYIHVLSTQNEGQITVEVYNPSANTWKCQEYKIPCATRKNFAVVHFRKKIYFLGGEKDDRAVSIVGAYNIIDGSYQELTSMKQQRRYFGVAVLNDFIYACGGSSDKLVLKSVERYCIESNSWEFVKPMNKGRQRAGIVASAGYIYAIGGCIDSETVLNSVERYDPRANKWVFVEQMPVPKKSFGTAALGGKLFVIGGASKNVNCLNVYGNKCLVYDPETDWWESCADLAESKGNIPVIIHEGRIWTIGGDRGIEGYVKTIEIFDPKTNSWSIGPSLPFLFGGATAILTPICNEFADDDDEH